MSRFYNSFGVRKKFARFEDFSAAVDGWGLNFIQLGPASSDFMLEQLNNDYMIYGRVRLGAAFHQQGVGPPGYRTFSILDAGSADFRWCGELMTSDSMLVLPETGEFDSVSTAGSSTFNVSFPLALLEWAAIERSVAPFSALLGPEQVLCLGPGEKVLKMRHFLQQYSEDLACYEQLSAGLVQSSGDLERSLALLFVDILVSTVIKRTGEAAGRRRQAVGKALDYLRESGQAPTNVNDLAHASGVSRRTLEMAFQDDLGVSPAHYLKVRRLNALRLALRDASPQSKSVAELGEACGLRHGGQMAADYLQLFGESPYATLKRST